MDGNKTFEETLPKHDKWYHPTANQISITFNNDMFPPDTEEDRNVIFTPGHPFKLIDNEDWHCEKCKERESSQIKARKKNEVHDKCIIGRKRDLDHCEMCELVKQGQFCWNSTYIIQFDGNRISYKILEIL